MGLGIRQASLWGVQPCRLAISLPKPSGALVFLLMEELLRLTLLVYGFAEEACFPIIPEGFGLVSGFHVSSARKGC